MQAMLAGRPAFLPNPADVQRAVYGMGHPTFGGPAPNPGRVYNGGRGLYSPPSRGVGQGQLAQVPTGRGPVPNLPGRPTGGVPNLPGRPFAGGGFYDEIRRRTAQRSPSKQAYFSR